jgi:hypothetical protein
VEVGLCPRERLWTELFGILDDVRNSPATIDVSKKARPNPDRPDLAAKLFVHADVAFNAEIRDDILWGSLHTFGGTLVQNVVAF